MEDKKKTIRDEVDSMIRKAAASSDSVDAMRWSQAAVNAANAACAIENAKGAGNR